MVEVWISDVYRENETGWEIPYDFLFSIETGNFCSKKVIWWNVYEKIVHLKEGIEKGEKVFYVE